MSLYYLILWNQVDILQKYFKKDHVHMRLWTRFYGIHHVYVAEKFITFHLLCVPTTYMQWRIYGGGGGV